jgi:large subunit ribosomal protein L18
MEHLVKKTRQKRERRLRAHRRVRRKVRGSAERPRLAVFKSLRYVYAQLIDDDAGVTLVSANSMEADLRGGPLGVDRFEAGRPQGGRGAR